MPVFGRLRRMLSGNDITPDEAEVMLSRQIDRDKLTEFRNQLKEDLGAKKVVGPRIKYTSGTYHAYVDVSISEDHTISYVIGSLEEDLWDFDYADIV